MTDSDIRGLLDDAVADVEPRNGVERIHARTASRRRYRAWRAGIASVAAVAVVAGIVAVTGLPGSRPVGPTPATQPRLVPVYFIGDTGAGPRLFRENRIASSAGGDATVQALQLALGGQSLDPDYRSAWPSGTRVERVRTETNGLVIDLDGSGLSLRPPGMTQATARMSVQQLVYTVRADVSDSPLWVRFEVDGAPVGTLLGASVGSVAPGPRDTTLAPVSILSPVSPQHARTTVSSPLTVTGEASAFEATVQWELRRGGATGPVVKSGFATAKVCCTPSPYRFTMAAPPGDYTLVVHDEDVSDGEGPPPSRDTKLLRVQ